LVLDFRAVIIGALLLAALVLERILDRYVRRSVEKGLKVYGREPIPDSRGRTEVELWERAYLFDLEHPIQAYVLPRLPYVVAAVFAFVVFFLRMGVSEGLVPAWIILTIWVAGLLVSTFTFLIIAYVLLRITQNRV
jgi:hypothetical protein